MAVESWNSIDELMDDLNKLSEFGSSRDLEIELNHNVWLDESSCSNDSFDIERRSPGCLPITPPKPASPQTVDSVMSEIEASLKRANIQTEEDYPIFKSRKSVGEPSLPSGKELNKERAKKDKLRFVPKSFVPASKEEWKPIERNTSFHIKKEEFPAL